MHDNAHIESFFIDLRDAHVSGIGVKETSYYPYLSNLFNVIGKKLNPKVRCIIHPRSIGAGLPDGALITADQKSKADDPLADGLIPSRGVLEVKAPDEDVESRRTCPKCSKEFLIENDAPKKPDSALKKPSGSVKSGRAVKRTKSR